MQMYSSKDFCVKTENAMSDKPANQNPLRNEFQVNNVVNPVTLNAVFAEFHPYNGRVIGLRKINMFEIYQIVLI